MTWKIGDPVVVLPNSNKGGGGTFTVASIGRKWFTVAAERGREWTAKGRKFSLDDGREDSDGVGGYCYAMTPAQATERARHDAASSRLRALTMDYSWKAVLSAEELDAISVIIECANARGKRKLIRALEQHLKETR